MQELGKEVHYFLCELFIYCPEEPLSVFIIQVNNEQSNTVEHRYRSLCYLRLMLWKFPKKTLKKYFENIRTLADVLVGDESIIIQEHFYFAIALMEKRFPLLAKKIFKLMGDKYYVKFTQIQPLLTDDLITKMDKILHNVGIEDERDITKLFPFNLHPLIEYIDDIMEVRHAARGKPTEEFKSHNKSRQHKIRKPKKILSYVDESVEEYTVEGVVDAKRRTPDIKIREQQPIEEKERWQRVINEKLKKLKMVGYGGQEPTIDECTEESKDTSIDQRIDQNSFIFSHIEFPRLRFRRKFRPKSLDPLQSLPGIYSPHSNTPKALNLEGCDMLDFKYTPDPFSGANFFGSTLVPDNLILSPISTFRDIEEAKRFQTHRTERTGVSKEGFRRRLTESIASNSAGQLKTVYDRYKTIGQYATARNTRFVSEDIGSAFLKKSKQKINEQIPVKPNIDSKNKVVVVPELLPSNKLVIILKKMKKCTGERELAKLITRISPFKHKLLSELENLIRDSCIQIKNNSRLLTQALDYLTRSLHIFKIELVLTCFITIGRLLNNKVDYSREFATLLMSVLQRYILEYNARVDIAEIDRHIKKSIFIVLKEFDTNNSSVIKIMSLVATRSLDSSSPSLLSDNGASLQFSLRRYSSESSVRNPPVTKAKTFLYIFS